MAKATRDRILTEGLDLLARHGFAGVTLSILADRAGLSKSGYLRISARKKRWSSAYSTR